MAKLFTPLKIKEVEFKNRIFVSPMCQYSSVGGLPTDWHIVHLGSRAVGGAGLVMTEATAVTPEGRISPDDTGIWSDDHKIAFQNITRFIRGQGAVAGIQLGHAGRKASTIPPWEGRGYAGKERGGWPTEAPSALAFDNLPVPREMNKEDIDGIIDAFADAARRSLSAGFQVIELHMAHGYLMHQFLSPLSNQRTDEYGGSLENRMRMPLEVTKAVRNVWPDDLPLFVRISATDWVDGGWDLIQSISLSSELKKIGVDLIDCSSGGLVPGVNIPVGPGYQTEFSEEIRKQVGILTGAVGMITDSAQAEHILTTEQSDVILMARQFLRDPYWPLHAAKELGVDVEWPRQYARAKQ